MKRALLEAAQADAREQPENEVESLLERAIEAAGVIPISILAVSHLSLSFKRSGIVQARTCGRRTDG
jgi:hypothetical protein